VDFQYLATVAVSLVSNYLIAKSHEKSKAVALITGFFFPIFSTVVYLFLRSRWSKAGKGALQGSRSSQDSPLGGGSSGSSADSGGTFTAIGSGSFDFEIVGESNYVAAIRRIAGSSREKVVLATLRREPTNKFDKNAVEVSVDGRQVGYIPRESAEEFHVPIQRVEQSGLTLTAWARVWFGEIDGRMVGSVRLDISGPSTAVPVNFSKWQNRSVTRWPSGKRVQVTGEESNMDSINEFRRSVGQSGSISAFFTLRAQQDDVSKSSIEVWADEWKVGTLSPQMAKKFQAACSSCASKGKELLVLGEMAGNSLSTSVTLNICNPEDLTEDQVQELLG